MNIFITGGTTGIGLGLAHAYQKCGHRVGICGRNLDKLSASDFSKFETYELDVRSLSQLKKAVNDFCQGDLDIMIANAGRSVGKKGLCLDFSEAKEIMDINYNGLLNAFEAALPGMLEKNKGQLVGIASVAGFVGLPGAGPYSASKAAVQKFLESLTLDLKGRGVGVTTINPGFIETPLTQKNTHAMPFIMSVEKAAPMMMRAIEKRMALYTFPWQMRYVMLFLYYLPRFFYRKIMGLKIITSSKDLNKP